MSELAEARASGGLARPTQTEGRIALSQRAIVAIACATDVSLTIVASIIGQLVYSLVWLNQTWQLDNALGIGCTAALVLALLCKVIGLYEFPVLLSPRRHHSRLVLAVFVAVFTVATILFLLKVGAVHSRGAIILFSLFEIVLVILGRGAVSGMVAKLVDSGSIAGHRAVVVGEPGELRRLEAVDLLHEFGFREAARVNITDCRTARGLSPAGRADLTYAMQLAREHKATELVVAIPWAQISLLKDIGATLRSSPLPVRLLPDRVIQSVLTHQAPNASTSDLAVEIQRAPLGAFELWLKRGLDITLALLGIFLLSPFLLLTSLCVKLDSSGPALFRQRRRGFDDRDFFIYKFRTMSVLEDGAKVTQAERNDRRVTAVGRVLRRTSIDELPQLFNVLKGDMSLVGPRPHAIAHDDEYRTLIGRYAFRHHVKPGLTGWAQVNGLRGETARVEQMEARVKYDLWYIDNWSLRLDLAILLRTCLAVFRSDAY